MRRLAESLLRQILRLPGFHRLWQKFIWGRPHYAFGMTSAAGLARALGYPGYTVIEFGVARGSRLLEMEHISREVSDSTPMFLGKRQKKRNPEGEKAACWKLVVNEVPPPPRSYTEQTQAQSGSGL